MSDHEGPVDVRRLFGQDWRQATVDGVKLRLVFFESGNIGVEPPAGLIEFVWASPRWRRPLERGPLGFLSQERRLARAMRKVAAAHLKQPQYSPLRERFEREQL